MTTEKQPEDFDDFVRRFMGGTTCHPYTLVAWKSECGKYLLLKKEGHSSYIDRSKGSGYCPGFYALYDWRNPQKADTSWSSVKYGGQWIAKWTGRWSKRKQAELLEAIRQHEVRTQIKQAAV